MKSILEVSEKESKPLELSSPLNTSDLKYPNIEPELMHLLIQLLQNQQKQLEVMQNQFRQLGSIQSEIAHQSILLKSIDGSVDFCADKMMNF